MSATLTDAILANILPSSGSAGISIVTADSYGISESYNGYYIIDNKKMLATNSNLPMVFGSSNITNIRPPVSPGMPSIVIPGKGFLNSTGKYLEMTAEFWLRVYTQSTNPIRIFGPINSEDGLYVEEEFLTLRIGKYTKSYFIGKSKTDCIKLDIYYTDKFIDPPLIYDSIRMATISEIIAMKLEVILRGGRKKDFWDIHELIENYSPEEMFDLHKKRYPLNHNKIELKNKFTDFANANNDFNPECLKGKHWELIQLDLEEFIEKLK
jgi:hypothetical protein